MIKLQNNTKTTFLHGNYKLGPGEILDVPENIAQIWQKHNNVIEYVAPEDAKAKEDAYEKEIAKLKAELEALKKEQMADTNKDNINKTVLDIEALKKEATDLGIQFASNIGAEKLKAKIEAKKAEQQ